MQPVGDLLKQTRAAKELSLEQAAMSTHIRKHYLEALERGDRAALPSAVHARGFLRLYAGYLGLDGEALVADWEGRPRPAAEPAPAPAAARKPAPSPAAPPPPVLPAEEPPPGADSVPEDEALPEEYAPPPAAPGSSQTILVEIGQTLRKQRERLGLSIDDIERHTHIRRRYLLALEAGRLDLLPSTVQCRGMLSNYAHFLNLDSEAILLRFAEALQSRRIEMLPPAPEPGARGAKGGSKNTPKGAQPAGALRRFLTPDLIFGVSLFLVLFVFVVWTVSRFNVAGSATPAVTLPSVSEMLLTTDTATPATPDAAALTAPAEQAAETTPGASAEGETTPAAGPAAQEILPANPAADTPAATLGAINTDPLQVYIVARQRTFLRVTIDGQLRFNGRLIPGSAYPFSGAEQIDLIIGSAGAVQLFYNQQEMAALGAVGDAVSLSFTQNGVQTPTPLPTASPTPTPLVTVTPTQGTPAASPTITPLIPTN